jgi:alkylation response protein AidB-like acyl-CoA dehydrogenase
VPKDAEGLSVGKFEQKMGIRGTATCELAFDNIRLPADALLGEEGAGFMMAMAALDGGRISVAAICAGLAEHAMTVARDYANERVAFGKPISKYQGLGFRFADMATEIKAMELLAYDAAATKAAGKRCSVEAAEAKLFAANRCMQICIDAQQVLGGNGYSKEYHVERFVRDARIFSVAEGTNEILRMIISGAVLAKK